MDYRMLACDYDGTLAVQGRVPPQTEAALADLKKAGFMAALVTGRELPDLLSVCPAIDPFDLVVAENGGVLYFPCEDQMVDLAAPPSPRLLKQLNSRKVPFSTGRVLVATLAQYSREIDLSIEATGLALQVIFNKGSAMVLPRGVDKASGLRNGAERLGLALSEIVAVGDAENDLPFLAECGLSVAVGDALGPVKAAADMVMSSGAGEAVVELIRDHLLSPGSKANWLASQRG